MARVMIWLRPMQTIDFIIWMPICALAAIGAPGILFILLSGSTP